MVLSGFRASLCELTEFVQKVFVWPSSHWAPELRRPNSKSQEGQSHSTGSGGRGSWWNAEKAKIKRRALTLSPISTTHNHDRHPCVLLFRWTVFQFIHIFVTFFSCWSKNPAESSQGFQTEHNFVDGMINRCFNWINSTAVKPLGKCQ